MTNETEKNKAHRWMESAAHGAPGFLLYEWVLVVGLCIAVVLLTRTPLLGGLSAVGVGWLLLYGRRRHDGRRNYLRLYLRRVQLPRHYRLLDADNSYRACLRGLRDESS